MRRVAISPFARRFYYRHKDGEVLGQQKPKPQNISHWAQNDSDDKCW